MIPIIQDFARTHYGVLFVVFVFALCIYALFNRSKPSWMRLVENAATIITSSGILFTFIGIYIGLQGFDITNINAGIDQLIEGMKTAFSSSVAGLALSFIFRIIQISKITPMGTRGVETSLASIHAVLLENKNMSREKLDALTEIIGGERDTSVVGQLTQLKTVSQEKLEELNREFKLFLQTMAENNSRALIEALSEVVRDFNTKLNEQFGENFKQLNEAVGKLVDWQENYRIQLEELIKSFEISKQSLQEVEDSMKQIAANAEKIPGYLHELKSIQASLNGQIEQLSETLSAFGEMKKNAQEAFPAIQQALSDITAKLEADLSSAMQKVQLTADNHLISLETSINSMEVLATQSKKVQENSQKMSDFCIKLVDETARGLDETVREYNQQILKMIDNQDEEYKKLIQRTADRMEETLQDGAKKLVNAVNQLDSEMEKEVSRVVEILGSNITSITDEFVTQYKRLMDSNRNSLEN